MLEQVDILFEKHVCKHRVQVASALKTTYMVLTRDLNMMMMMRRRRMMMMMMMACFKQAIITFYL